MEPFPSAWLVIIISFGASGTVACQRAHHEANDRAAILPHLAEAINPGTSLAYAAPGKDLRFTQKTKDGSSKDHCKEALHHGEGPLIHPRSTDHSHFGNWKPKQGLVSSERE